MLIFTTSSSFQDNWPYSVGMDKWIITKFGIAIAETCEKCNWQIHFGPILHNFKSTGLKFKQRLFLHCFCCYLRLYRLSTPFFLFSSFQTFKRNVFVLPISKFYHCKSFPSIPHSVGGGV